MILKPDIEYSSADQIKALQQEKLNALLKYLSEYSPFYKERFVEAGIDFSKGISIEDLVDIPPTTKDDMQTRNWDFLCVPRESIAEYMSTSGTLGKPVVVALTHADLRRLAYNEAISFACTDPRPGELYQLMLTLDRQFMAGMAYYSGIHQMGGSVVRVGPGVPAMQLDTIQRLKPDAIVAVPSFLVRLIEYAQQQGVDLNTTSVRKAICIGESLRGRDLKKSVVAQKITDAWNIELYGTYASTEMQTAFTECSAQQGGHLHPELIIVELLDDENNPVKDGEPGEITITTLGVEGMPLLRFKTGDIAVAYNGTCTCGRTTVRLGPILGRKQQQIKLKGTTIYPPGIFEILNELEFINDYVVEVFTGELGTDELLLHVETRGEISDSMLSTISRHFQSRLRVTPNIEFTTPGMLEKIQFKPGDRKPRKFIDSRKS